MSSNKKQKAKDLFSQASASRVDSAFYKWQNDQTKAETANLNYVRMKGEFENLLGPQIVQKFEASVAEKTPSICLEPDLKDTLSCVQEAELIGLEVLNVMELN